MTPDAPPCVFCNGDTSFIATCRGLCVPCGDRLQATPLPMLVEGLAAALLELREKKAALLRLERLVKGEETT